MGVDRGVLAEVFGNNPTIASQVARPTSIMHVESRVFWLPICTCYTQLYGTSTSPELRSPVQARQGSVRALSRDTWAAKSDAFVWIWLFQVVLPLKPILSINYFVVSLYFLLVSNHHCRLPGRKAMEMQEKLPRMRVNITHAERSWAKVGGM